MQRLFLFSSSIGRYNLWVETASLTCRRVLVTLIKRVLTAREREGKITFRLSEHSVLFLKAHFAHILNLEETIITIS